MNKIQIIKEFDKDRLFNDKDEKDLREFILVDGKKVYKHGHWEYLFDDGSVCARGTFINGYAEGFWQIFHENGKLSQRGFYIKSNRYSINEYGDTWEYYDEEGNSEYHMLGFDRNYFD